MTVPAVAALAEHATAIRALRSRIVRDVAEIGRRLIEAKRLVGHGNWLPWLDREFGWTDDTALNFMRVHEFVEGLSNSETFRDLVLTLPVSSVYLLAAPSTPKEAVNEILDRAQAGEVVPVAEAKRVVERHRRPSSKPRKAKGARKLEAFFDSLMFVTTGCTALVEREIPDLNKKQQAEVIAQLEEASAALSTFGNRFKNDSEKAARDDIGADGRGEAEDLRVRVEELEADKHRLGIENLGLRSEIVDLRGKLAAGGAMSFPEFQAAIKKYEETVETQRAIITRLENENAKLRAGVAAPPPHPLDIPGFLDRTKRKGAVAP